MNATATQAPAAAPPAGMGRFAAGAVERFAGTFKDQALTIGAAAQQYDTIMIAAGDYTAGIYLHMTATTAGNGAAVAFQADGPWSAIHQVELLDPTGTAFQVYSGYELMLFNAIGGFTGQGIRSDSPNYLATTGAGATGGSFGFILRVPCILSDRDAAGALWNGTTSAQFQVKVTLAPSTAVYSTPPTVLPSVRLRVNSHGYQVPGIKSIAGQEFTNLPPGGQMYQNLYRQYSQWSAAGGLIIPFNRKGYLLRQLILVVRDVAGARSNAILTGDVNMKIDNVDVFNGSVELLRETTWERNMYATGAALPAGVLNLSWAFDWDGKNGGESRDQYRRTEPGSIIELRANASAAGQLAILTNDVTVTKEAIRDGVVRV